MNGMVASAVFAAIAVWALITALVYRQTDLMYASAVVLFASCLFLFVFALRGGRYVRRGAQPNAKGKCGFYDDRFEYECTSGASYAKHVKRYSEIKKVRFTKDYIFVFFDGKVAPIVKADLGEALPAVCNLLGLAPEAITKTGGRVRQVLLAWFILSILSVLLAAVCCEIAVFASPWREFGNTILEYMWVFYVFIPLPLSSAILGLVFLPKKYKCKKNIVAGFIVSVMLAVYGSFTPILGSKIGHDFGVISDVEAELPIDLPDEGRVSYSIGLTSQLDARVKFDDKQELLRMIQRDGWLDDASRLIGLMPAVRWFGTGKKDYFYLYDVDCKRSNGELTSLHRGHEYIFLSYSAEEDVVSIVRYTAQEE